MERRHTTISLPAILSVLPLLLQHHGAPPKLPAPPPPSLTSSSLHPYKTQLHRLLLHCLASPSIVDSHRSCRRSALPCSQAALLRCCRCRILPSHRRRARAFTGVRTTLCRAGRWAARCLPNEFRIIRELHIYLSYLHEGQKCLFTSHLTLLVGKMDGNVI